MWFEGKSFSKLLFFVISKIQFVVNLNNVFSCYCWPLPFQFQKIFSSFFLKPQIQFWYKNFSCGMIFYLFSSDLYLLNGFLNLKLKLKSFGMHEMQERCRINWNDTLMKHFLRRFLRIGVLQRGGL